MREYMYNRFVRDRIGKKKIVQIKFSTVKRYYSKLLNVDGLKANTIDTIHTLLFPAFALAVRDGYIRMNPADGAMVDIKKSDSWSKEKRHALTAVSYTHLDVYKRQEFELSVDMETAANDVRDKVSRAQRYLPRDADPPTVAKADADADPIMQVTVESPVRSLDVYKRQRLTLNMTLIVLN